MRTLSKTSARRGRVVGAINEIGAELDNEAGGRRQDDEGRHRFAPLEVGLPEKRGTSASASVILTDHDGWKSLEMGELAPAIPPEAEVGKVQDHFNEAEALALAHHLHDLVKDLANGTWTSRATSRSCSGPRPAVSSM